MRLNKKKNMKININEWMASDAIRANNNRCMCLFKTNSLLLLLLLLSFVVVVAVAFCNLFLIQHRRLLLLVYSHLFTRIIFVLPKMESLMKLICRFDDVTPFWLTMKNKHLIALHLSYNLYSKNVFVITSNGSSDSERTQKYSKNI